MVYCYIKLSVQDMPCKGIKNTGLFCSPAGLHYLCGRITNTVAHFSITCANVVIILMAAERLVIFFLGLYTIIVFCARYYYKRVY